MAPKKGLIEKEIPNLETITTWSVYISFRVFLSQKDGQKGNLKDFFLECFSGPRIIQRQSFLWLCASFQIGGFRLITLLDFFLEFPDAAFEVAKNY